MVNGVTKDRSKTERRFFDSNQKEGSRAQHDTERMTVTFCETDEILEMDLGSLDKGVLQAAAAFGIMTSVTNAAGGHHPTDSPFVRACDRWATLSEDNVWQGEREGGGARIGDIVEAAVSFGYDRDTVTTKLKGGEVTAATLMQNKAIAAKVLEIRAQKAIDKAKAAKAGSNDSDDLDALLG